MKELVLIVALGTASAMAGEMVSLQDGNTFRFGDEPCTSESVLNHLDPAHHMQFHAASAIVQGRNYAACWRMTPNGAAHLVYEDGDEGLVPLKNLRPLLNI